MDGILAVDKPQGMTSHDVVDFVRKRFGLRKAGHAGTLDPMATGVLIILIGASTKSANSFLTDDKEYEATMVLGAVSDTGDAWGRLTPLEKSVSFPEGAIEEAFKRFRGPLKQAPPMYSAVKYKGARLYELARKGASVDVASRDIHVKSLDITAIALPEVSFRVLCSKGTYVRKLCMDIGDVLGCGAYLSRLRRLSSGNFRVDKAVGMDRLRTMKKEELERELIHT
jgi:tRNA pseudouridine55 synthase